MSKKIGIIVGAVIVLLLATWFGGSWYASKKAEEQLEEFVYSNGLQKVVYWDKVSASVLGSVTVSNMNIVFDKRNAFLIKELNINSFTDDYDRKLIDLSIHGLTDKDGKAPSFITKDLAKEIGKVQIESIGGKMKVDINYDSDEGELEFGLDVPHVGSIATSAHFKQIRPIRSILDSTRSKDLEGLGALALMGELAEAAEEIRFLDAVFSVKDDGFMKRQLALYKRYAEVPLPSKDLDKQQENLLKQYIRTGKESCIEELEVRNAKSTCEEISNFLAGEKSSLSVKIKAKGFKTIKDVADSISEESLSGLEIEVD